MALIQKVIQTVLQHTFIRFCLVGLVLTLIDYLIYIQLLTIIPLFFAKWAAYLLATFISFFANKYWSFQSHQGKNKQQLSRYYCLYFSSSIINSAIALLIFDYIIAHHIVSFIGATGCSLCVNYFGLRYWIFAASSKKNQSGTSENF